MYTTDKECEYEMYTTIEKGHGRIEKKNILCIKWSSIFNWLFSKLEGVKKNICSKKRSGKRWKKDERNKLLLKQ